MKNTEIDDDILADAAAFDASRADRVKITPRANAVRPRRTELPDDPKPTPGPWTAEWQTGTWRIMAGSGQPVACVDFWKHTDCADGHKPESEQKANAALLASAPDLLTVLKDLLDCAWPNEPGSRTDRAMVNARAAILKAERGES